MSHYTLPPSVAEDFASFKESHADFMAGKLDALTFKTIRVPFGIYEQRESDTYMVRVKLAGGILTPTQLHSLALLAEHYAKPHLHVTTRGGVQLHYAKLQDLPQIIQALHEIGLTGRGGGGNTVRNITADPYAGIAPDEAFDITPCALSLTTKMLETKDSYSLPRKFKIAFSGSSEDRGGATYIDVGFIAKIHEGVRGFRLFVAGGMGAKSRLGSAFIDFLPQEEIFLFAQAIKQVFDQHGNRKNKHAARLRFLIEELGEAQFRELVFKEVQALRDQGGWEIKLEEAFEATPLERAELPLLNQEQKLWWNRFVIPQKQKGYYSAKVPLKLGDLESKHAKSLAQALQGFKYGKESIRFGSDQNLYLRNLQADELLSLYPLIQELSGQSSRARILGDMVACTGAATCQLGITRPRGAVVAIEKALQKANIDLDALQGFRIHLSGCPNSCGKHAIADLGFFGKVNREGGHPYPAYNVLVGAIIQEDSTRFAKKIAEVSAYALPLFVTEVLKLWLHAKPHYANFAAWVDQEGEAQIIHLAASYAKIPSFEEDKNPYFDYGSEEIFSLKGRGTGECSAGMYDLIEADKKALKEALEGGDEEENLAKIRLLASRMLLITKGEEARDERSVLQAFRRLFIEGGLIDSSFAPLLEGRPRIELKALGEAVIALYGTMDNSLKFAKEQPKEAPLAPASSSPSAHRFKDYQGVACPMNFVKTKMDLAQMQSGEILEILLDEGAPIENVPKSVANEGHLILGQTKEGKGWRVRIQKR
ncbi:MAG: sulfurtransferase TusA family protein [Wolinella sp.]